MMENNFIFGPDAQKKADEENEIFDRQNIEKAQQEEREIKERFDGIKIGDSISYKDRNGALDQGADNFVVLSKDPEHMTVAYGPKDGAYSFQINVHAKDIVDSFTPRG